MCDEKLYCVKLVFVWADARLPHSLPSAKCYEQIKNRMRQCEHTCYLRYKWVNNDGQHWRSSVDVQEALKVNHCHFIVTGKCEQQCVIVGALLNASELCFMSSNIDLSACKGKISPINTRCLWNTDDAVTLQSSAVGFQPHAWRWAAGKWRGGTWERPERTTGIGERLSSKMKHGERAGMERMTISEMWKGCQENECIFWKTRIAGSIITYWLSDVSRQALSIPGNDIMVSTRWLDFGFWLLRSQ